MPKTAAPRMAIRCRRDDLFICHLLLVLRTEARDGALAPARDDVEVKVDIRRAPEEAVAASTRCVVAVLVLESDDGFTANASLTCDAIPDHSGIGVSASRRPASEK